MCATRSPTTSPRLRIRCVCARPSWPRYRPRTVIGVRWGRDESRLPRQARASCPLRHRCVPTEPSAASSRLRHQTSARNVRGTRDQVPRHARRRRQKDMGRSLTAPHGARRGLGGKSEFGGGLATISRHRSDVGAVLSHSPERGMRSRQQSPDGQYADPPTESATTLEDFDRSTRRFYAGIIPTGDPVIRGEI